MAKLIYIANIRMPTEKAHGIQIMQNCEAFTDNGIEVSLWVARRINTREMRGIKDPWVYYGVKPNFRIRRLPTLDFLSLVKVVSWRSKLFFYIQEVTFVFSAVIGVLLAAANIYYSRDALVLLLLSLFKPKHTLAYEVHSMAKGKGGVWLQRRVARRVGTVIAITAALREEMIAFGADPRRVLLAHDGVRRERFENTPSRIDARHAVGWREDAFIVGYVGRLHTMAMDKGVGVLIEALASIWLRPGGIPVSLAIVGGPDDMAEVLRAQWLRLGLDADRFLYAGQVLPDQVPVYLSAFDVCAMPFPWTEHFAYYASPIKLFEYMAARRVIVASDLPALADVVTSEEHALLVPPSDVHALAEAILRLYHDPLLRQQLADHAYERVMAHHTWGARAKLILKKLAAARHLSA